MTNSINIESGALSQREYIVAKATDMFIEQGIKAVRMDDIAHELSISKRTLYEMFADKRELLNECLAFHINSNNEFVRKVLCRAENVIEEVMLIIRIAYETNENSRVFMRSVEKYYPELSLPFKERQAAYGSKMFRNMLQRGLDDEVFVANMNIEFTEAMFNITLGGLVASIKMSLPEGVTFRDAVSYFIINFFRGIATAKGLAMIDEYKLKYDNYKIKL